MARILLEVCVITLVLVFKGCTASERLIDTILYNHNPDRISITQANETMTVNLSLTLVSIRTVDMERNEVEIVAWLGSQYNIPSLKWEASVSEEHQVVVPEWSVWKPDLAAYNGVNAPETTMSPPPQVLISRNGDVFYMRPLRFRFLCHLELVSSPDGTICILKIGSWVYNGFQMRLGEPSDVDLSYYFPNPKYEVISTSVQRNIQHYECCPESYYDISYTFTIREKGADKKLWSKWF